MDHPGNLARLRWGVVAILAVAAALTMQLSASAGRLFDSPISPLPTPQPPVILSVEPPNIFQSSEAEITIRGINFGISGTAFVDAVPITVTSWRPGAVRCRVSQLAAGPHDVKVCATGGCSTLSAGLTVNRDDEPVMTGVMPGRGFSDVRNRVDISGHNFRSGLTVTLGNDPLGDVEWISSLQARAVVPSGLTPGTYDLAVQNPGVTTSSTLTSAYTVLKRGSDDLYAADDDLWTDPLTLSEGQTVRVGLNVHRAGGTGSLSFVPVDFAVCSATDECSDVGRAYLSNMAPGPGSTQSVSVAWVVPDGSGAWKLRATIDPTNIRSETSEANNTVERTVFVLPAGHGHARPEPPILVVNGGASITQARVITAELQTSAGVSLPATMYLAERIFNPAAGEWILAHESGWMSFSPSVQFTLTEMSGLHFLQAWVSDAAGNISPGSEIVGVAYVPAEQTIYAGQAHVFRETLAAGQALTATLTTLSGDADLYLWSHQGVLLASSYLSGLAVDQIAFVAPAAGTYQLEVRGYADSSYHLDLTHGNAARSPRPSQARLATGKNLPSAPAIAPNQEPAANMALPPAEWVWDFYKLYLAQSLQGSFVTWTPPAVKVYMPLVVRPGQ